MNDLDKLLSIYARKRISAILFQIDFWNKRFCKPIETTRNKLNNTECINNLSCFYGWTKMDKAVVFFSNVEFVCSFKDKKGESFTYNCYPKSTYFIYTSTGCLEIFIYDLQIKISVKNGIPSEVSYFKSNDAMLSVMSTIFLKTQGKLSNV